MLSESQSSMLEHPGTRFPCSTTMSSVPHVPRANIEAPLIVAKLCSQIPRCVYEMITCCPPPQFLSQSLYKQCLPQSVSPLASRDGT